MFPVPRPPKINIFCPCATKKQYFLSPEHQKSILCVPKHQKSIFSVPGTLKIQYLLSREHQTPSAVAGTQLCCALDPPRQALGLRMAYRVPLP